MTKKYQMNKAATKLDSLVLYTTHYQAEGSTKTGCGREAKEIITSDIAREVDCGACRKTRIFKSYAI